MMAVGRFEPFLKVIYGILQKRNIEEFQFPGYYSNITKNHPYIVDISNTEKHKTALLIGVSVQALLIAYTQGYPIEEDTLLHVDYASCLIHDDIKKAAGFHWEHQLSSKVVIKLNVSALQFMLIQLNSNETSVPDKIVREIFRFILHWDKIT